MAKKKQNKIPGTISDFVDSMKVINGVRINDSKPPEKISTGSILFDDMLDGGIPVGKLTEFYGQPSSGKSSFALAIAANVVKNGGHVMWIDLENSFDPTYAERFGITVSQDNLNFILVNGALPGEVVMGMINNGIKTNQLDLIVLDSVTAVIPSVDVEKEIGTSKIGSLAALLSNALRDIINSLSESNTALIFINQERSKINPYGGASSDSTGGYALKFYASLRIKFRQIEYIQEQNEPLGIKSELYVKKSKVSVPNRKSIIEFYFDRGFNVYQEIFILALSKDIIKRGGAWYTYKDYKWQGALNAIRAIEEDKKLFEELKSQI